MPALDPALPGALILIVAVVIAAVAVWLIDRRRGGKRGGALHGMGRDESLSYFRDYGDSASASGVREEDRAERWGEDDRSPPP